MFPLTAVDAIRALIREADEDDDERTCTACAWGLGFRYKKDPFEPEVGMRMALRRALRNYTEDKTLRRRVWEEYLEWFPPEGRELGLW